MNKPRQREGFIDQDPVDIEVEANPRDPRAREPEPEAPPVAAVGQEFKWPFIYKLRYRPLKIHNETIDELTFREPTAGDVLDFGNPVNIEVKQSGKQFSFDIHIDDNKMMFVLGNLCTDKRVLSLHLHQLDLRDFANIANKLRRFFRPDWDMVNY